MNPPTQAERPDSPLHVHQLCYADAPELAAFHAATDREVGAFAYLAESQARLALPLDMGSFTSQQLEPFKEADELRGGHSRLLAGPDVHLDVYTQNQLTRTGVGAGVVGSRNRPAPRRLVVDVREFMAVLPGVLHRQGFYITPVTLEVRLREGGQGVLGGGGGTVVDTLWLHAPPAALSPSHPSKPQPHTHTPRRWVTTSSPPTLWLSARRCRI